MNDEVRMLELLEKLNLSAARDERLINALSDALKAEKIRTDNAEKALASSRWALSAMISDEQIEDERALSVQCDWKIPNLPERLKRLAEVLIENGGQMGTDELKPKLGWDPARIFFDYQQMPMKNWIRKHIAKPGRGVYLWLPITDENSAQSLLKVCSTKKQKRIKKLSK